jgi:hypothetical protein
MAFSLCANARAVRWDDLARLFPTVPAAGAFVVVCTRAPGGCACGEPLAPTRPDPGTAAAATPDNAAPDNAAPDPVTPKPVTPVPGGQSRFRLADLLAMGSLEAQAPERARGRVRTATGRRRRSVPHREATIWLEAEMRLLRELWDYNHLFQEWLLRYMDEMGRAPEDPRRSFTDTAERCARRIRGV